MMVLTTLALFFALCCLAIVDLREFRLPDVLTLPLIGAGLVLAFVDRGTEGLLINGVGAVLGLGALWLLATVYRARTGRHGLGLGDAKLLGAAGAWLGPALLSPIVLTASSAGLVWAVLSGRSARLTRIPFGPFLCGAFFLFWCVSGGGAWW